MIDTILSYLGVLGAVMCILAFALLERGKLSAEGLGYYLMNGVGAVFILVAALWSYDSGDLGVAVQEFCWIAVSLMGMIRVLQKKRVKNDQN
jgi:hypothetical protein